MKNYEAVFILDSELGEDEIERVVEEIQELIVKTGGRVEESEKWGRRQLAYEIGKKREGWYLLLSFKAEPKDLANLRKDYQLKESILKHTIFRKE